MVEYLAEYFVYAIERAGYAGAGFLMALESMIAPVPSELVMPFVGFLVAEGKFDVLTAIVATSIGSLVGSLVSYWMGYYGGRPFVLSVGRYLFLNLEHLTWTEQWFAKHGSWTIFISRFIPVVRHLISIPAGVGKMRFGPFCLYTVVGATIWNSFLLGCGYTLRQNWTIVQQYSHIVDIGVVAALLICAGWYAVRHYRQSGADGNSVQPNFQAQFDKDR
jgi:membrane protein DedA with SNARE-associated domain